MVSLSRLLWRLLVAGLGFSAAAIASLVIGVLGLGTVASAERVGDGDLDGIVALVLGLLHGSVLLPLFAVMVWPAWVAAIVLGEVTATRSLFAHLVVATGIAVVGVMGGAPVVGLLQIKVTVAIGLVAGFTHWLVAGRGAGLMAPRPVDRPMVRPVAGTVEGATRPAHDGAAGNGISGENSNP